jgi:hypothetical protein
VTHNICFNIPEENPGAASSAVYQAQQWQIPRSPRGSQDYPVLCCLGFQLGAIISQLPPSWHKYKAFLSTSMLLSRSRTLTNRSASSHSSYTLRCALRKSNQPHILSNHPIKTNQLPSEPCPIPNLVATTLKSPLSPTPANHPQIRAPLPALALQEKDIIPPAEQAPAWQIQITQIAHRAGAQIVPGLYPDVCLTMVCLPSASHHLSPLFVAQLLTTRHLQRVIISLPPPPATAKSKPTTTENLATIQQSQELKRRDTRNIIGLSTAGGHRIEDHRATEADQMANCKVESD